MRVWLAQYKHKWSITTLKEKVGEVLQEKSTFDKLREYLLEHFIKQGRHDVRAPWSEFKKKLEFEESHRTQIIAPDEELIPWKEYVDEEGEPTTNGLGHREATINGVRGVLVPTTGRIKVRRLHEVVVKETTELDNNETNVQLQPDQMRRKMLDIRNSFFTNQATGATADSMAANKQDPAKPLVLAAKDVPRGLPLTPTKKPKDPEDAPEDATHAPFSMTSTFCFTLSGLSPDSGGHGGGTPNGKGKGRAKRRQRQQWNTAKGKGR